MLSILYVSVADPDLDNQSIAALVERTQQNNRENGLTGTLLFNGTNFLQALEGDAETVEACIERIRADTRHHGMSEIARQKLAEREFAGFEMFYVPYTRPDDTVFARLEETCQMGAQTKQIVGSFLALGGR